MPRHKTVLPVEDVKNAIVQYRGNVSRIAEHFGVERTVIYLKMRSKPTLVQAHHDQKEARKDRIEAGFDAAIDRGERWAISLGLAMLCGDRGYVTKASGIFGEDGPGQVTQLTVNNISIQGIEHDRFAPAGTESVHIEAIAPPPEPDPESEDDTLIIEGEFTEADDAGS